MAKDSVSWLKPMPKKSVQIFIFHLIGMGEYLYMFFLSELAGFCRLKKKSKWQTIFLKLNPNFHIDSNHQLPN
jgi:hypothetical protein